MTRIYIYNSDDTQIKSLGEMFTPLALRLCKDDLIINSFWLVWKIIFLGKTITDSVPQVPQVFMFRKQEDIHWTLFGYLGEEVAVKQHDFQPGWNQVQNKNYISSDKKGNPCLVKINSKARLDIPKVSQTKRVMFGWPKQSILD